jgi:cobalt transporter subunit CbtB
MTLFQLLPTGRPRRKMMTTAVQTQTTVEASTRVIALVVFLIGAGLVGATGFAHSQTLHNAAHDSRHALAFPCH